MQTIQRFSKGEALTTVAAIYRGESVDPLHIEFLINYLLPVLPKPPKNVWDFVSRAVGVKDMRYYLNAVHVLDNVAYATDGHRLHYAAVEGFENGVYGTNKKRIDDASMIKSIDFFKKVIPDSSNWQPIKYDVELIGTGNSIKRVAMMAGLAEDNAINLSYLLDAFTFDKKDMYATSRDDDYQISIKNKFGRAVIMATRI